jgi:hypothetical protein
MDYELLSAPDIALAVFRQHERELHRSAQRIAIARAVCSSQSRECTRVLWALRKAVRAWLTNAHLPQAASSKTDAD